MNKNTILLADEDPFTLEYLTGLLQTEGYSVITAKDGIDAITKSYMPLVKLVIVNLNMPIIPGLSILEKIKKFQPHLNVIIMSGISSEETKRKALECGAYSFMEKPINPSILRKHICDILKDDNKTLNHKAEE